MDEQYRSRIGSHDSFVKTKAVLLRLRGRFWNITFMMLYLNVFYLPTLKKVVGQYKMGNEVKFWFTQMTFYNICILLIIRQANDVEEYPGPTQYLKLLTRHEQFVLTTIKQMKYSLVKMLVSIV